MYKEYKIGVAIPAYNEEKHIKDTIETLPDFVDKKYVVDDGSTDKTAEIVKTLTDKRIRLLQHELNKGMGAALVTDKHFLLEKGKRFRKRKTKSSFGKLQFRSFNL